jgi:hypothetical protein
MYKLLVFSQIGDHRQIMLRRVLDHYKQYGNSKLVDVPQLRVVYEDWLRLEEPHYLSVVGSILENGFTVECKDNRFVYLSVNEHSLPIDEKQLVTDLVGYFVYPNSKDGFDLCDAISEDLDKWRDKQITFHQFMHNIGKKLFKNWHYADVRSFIHSNFH